MPSDDIVTSRSALATLTASASTLASDPLLSLVVNIAPKHQLTVVVIKAAGGGKAGGSEGGKGNASKKGGKGKGKGKGGGKAGDAQPSAAEGGAVVEPPGFSLVAGPDSLAHRNAALRALCGGALHGALDALFLGGHYASSCSGASPVSSLALAGVSSWMSVASSVRENSATASVLLGQVNRYLARRSFLVPGAVPTIADFDVYLALASALEADDGLEKALGKELKHVRRWAEQCAATLEDLVAKATTGGNALEVRLPRGLTPKARPLPVFFYGDEDADVVAAAAVSTATKSAGPSKPATGANGAKAAAGAAGGEGGKQITDEQKKEAADKKAKKAAEKAAKKKDQPKPTPKAGKGGGGTPALEVDVSALDIRVGKILKAWEHESAEKLYCEEVDVGEESGPRKIASGLRPFYKLEEMQNRTVLVLCNLKARNLVGFPSHGMVMCASNADHTKVEFAVPPEGAKIGERVIFEGYDGEPEAENKVAKKKMFEKIAPDLKTDETGEISWKGKKATTSAGICKAVNGMPNAQVS